MDLRATRHTVRADPVRLQQVFWNLLKNAVQFTPAGGTLIVRSADHQGAVRVEVQDTGVGIDPAALARIFDAFEQGGRQVTRQFGGLGLGLSISKAIVDLHRGSLSAHSEGREKGATFRIAFPVIAAPGPGELVLPACNGPGASGGSLSARTGGARPLHILLVEDHPDTARTLQRLLTRRGHRVTAAGGVAEALGLLRGSGWIDLIVSDLGLPDGSGLDLIREALKIQPVRGIALTGFGMEEDVHRSREAGFDVHLTKPVDIAALERAIGELVCLSTRR